MCGASVVVARALVSQLLVSQRCSILINLSRKHHRKAICVWCSRCRRRESAPITGPRLSEISCPNELELEPSPQSNMCVAPSVVARKYPVNPEAFRAYCLPMSSNGSVGVPMLLIALRSPILNQLELEASP